MMWGSNDPWWGLVMMIVFWGGLAALVWALVRGAWGGRRDGGKRSARDVLDERFARGEIDEEEYERRRRILSAG